MAHDRHQLLAQHNSQFLYMLASLVKACLYRIVLYVVFFGDRCSLLESLCRFLLFPLHHIQITCQSRDNLGCAGTILTHILEYWSQHIDVTQLVKPFKQHQQAFIRAACQCLLETLRIDTCCLDDLILLLEHIHNQLRNGGCRHLHRLSLTIQHSSKTHDLWDGHLCLCTYTRHSLGEIGQVWSRCCTVLGKLVDNGTDRKQRFLRSQPFLIAEDVGQLGKCQRSPVTQFIKGYVYLVCSVDEAQNVLFGLLSQLTSILSQHVELFTACSGIHLLELLIQVRYLLLCHSREFADVGHLSVHVRKSLNSRTSGHDKASNGGNHSHQGCLPVVHLSVEAVPESLTNRQVGIHTGNLCLHLLDGLCLTVPFNGTTLYAVQLLLQGVERLV